MLSGSQRYYYSRNQQYSITALTDSSGNIVERYRYDAYGNTVILSPTGEVLDQSSVGNVFMYTGRYNHPEIGLMYFRARYYSPQLGQFISRDPLGYVDGMSQYRAYFVPGGMDPFGLEKLVAYFKGGAGVFPVYKTLFQKCYYHTQLNGQPVKIDTECPGPKGDRLYEHGFKQLSEIAKRLKKMCNTCTSKENCRINPGKCTKRKCKSEAKIIQKALTLAWASNYGRGNGTGEDCVAGSFCWDWEYVFRTSIVNQKLTCFRTKSVAAIAPERKNKKTGELETPVHYFSRLYAGNFSDDCTTVIDDGFSNDQKTMIHDAPFLKPGSIYVEESDPKLIKPVRPIVGLAREGLTVILQKQQLLTKCFFVKSRLLSLIENTETFLPAHKTPQISGPSQSFL